MRDRDTEIYQHLKIQQITNKNILSARINGAACMLHNVDAIKMDCPQVFMPKCFTTTVQIDNINNNNNNDHK